jgi:hypothetical protein
MEQYENCAEKVSKRKCVCPAPYKHPAKYLNETVTVEAEVIKKYPTGYWWYVKDQTGEIRADSVAAGFGLALHQEGHTAAVS